MVYKLVKKIWKEGIGIRCTLEWMSMYIVYRRKHRLSTLRSLKIRNNQQCDRPLLQRIIQRVARRCPLSIDAEGHHFEHKL